MKSVLLTGAAGFIGRHCLSELIGHGIEIHAVSSRSTPERDSAVHWHRADLLHKDQVSKLIRDVQPTHLLHLAWVTDPMNYHTSHENLLWTEASIHLLKSFYEYGGNRVVMAGSCLEYDWNYGFCREDTTPLKPDTLYGSCKHALQTVLNSFSQQIGLSAAWARIFFLYGPYSHRAKLPGVVIESLLNGQVARCSHGNQIRDFLYIGDAANALVKLLAGKVQGAVNIASGKPTKVGDMIHKTADIIGRRDLVQLGAIGRKNEPPVLLADVSRLRDELGWSPKVELEQGLEYTVQWWQRNRYRHAS